MINVDPADQVDVYLKFNSSHQQADVSPCGTGMVYFAGVVQVKFPEHYPRPPTEINVTLTPEDTWNTSKVTPEFLIFTENGEKAFNVSVCAPKGELRNTVGQVIIKGFWVSNSAGLMGETRPDALQGRVDINPFYNFSVCCQKNKIEGRPGEQLTFYLEITNEGNIRNTIQINDDFEKKFEENNVISLSQRTLDLEPNETKKIKVILNINDDLENLDTYNLKFNVTSLHSRESKELEIKLEVPEIFFYQTDEFCNLVFVTIGLIILVFIARRWYFKGKKGEKTE
jgi:hypothetical protein